MINFSETVITLKFIYNELETKNLRKTSKLIFNKEFIFC